MGQEFGIPTRYDEYNRLIETITYLINKEKGNPGKKGTVEQLFRLKNKLIENDGIVKDDWEFSCIITMLLNYFVPDEISKRYADS